MRQGGELKLSPAQHLTRQNRQKLRPFGLSLSVICMEISHSLDCLVRIAVLREAVSLEIPCNYCVFSRAMLLPTLSMRYSRHFWMAWPLLGVQRAGNLQGI
jgi:hypothetical protein